MEQQSRLPLTTEALSETSAAGSNAATVLEYYLENLNQPSDFQHLGQSCAPYSLDPLIALDIGPWTFPAHHIENSAELLAVTNEYAHHGIDGGLSIPETSTASFSQERSYTISNHNQHIQHTRHTREAIKTFPAKGLKRTLIISRLIFRNMILSSSLRSQRPQQRDV